MNELFSDISPIFPIIAFWSLSIEDSILFNRLSMSETLSCIVVLKFAKSFS